MLTVTTDTAAINNIGKYSTDKLTDIIRKYRGTVLNEPDGKVGKVKDVQLELNIDASVQSVVQKVRNTPFHLRKLVEKQIEQLIKEDIIEEVKGPTPWVSPIVIDHKKDGDIRICTDEASQ